MRRPGNLNGFEGLASRAHRRALRNGFGDLGGKGAYTPAPSAPPGKKVLDSAINSRSKKYYEQDTRCPEGETTKSVPCVGVGCDPGEMEDDCVDDPFYLEFPDSTYQYCSELKRDPAWRIFPGNIIQDYCRKQALEESPKDAVKAPSADASSPDAPPESDDTKALREELESLEESEDMATGMMQSSGIPPISATYTGGSVPTGLPRRSTPSAPTSAQKISAMVSAHQERKAMARAGRRPAPMALPSVAAAAPPAPAVGIRGLITRIRNTLFGTQSGFSGLGQADEPFDKKNLLLLAAAAGVVYCVCRKK